MPHGMANALLLTHVIRFNASPTPQKMGTFPQYAYPDALQRYARIAKILGVEGESDETLLEGLCAKLEALKEQLHIPKTIREAIGDRGTESAFLESLDKMSQDAFDDQCTGANPRYPLVSEIKELYLQAYYGEQSALKH